MENDISPFVSVSLKKLFDIEAIVTIHYFEYMSDFSYPGEAHAFWEILCVDKGELEVYNGKKWLDLKKGSIIFHQPNEFHSLKANKIVAPNIVVISFICNSPAMNFFKEKTFNYSFSERDYLAKIVQNAREVFKTPLDDPYVNAMEKRSECLEGAEQLIQINLELLLLSFYQLYGPNPKDHESRKIILQREKLWGMTSYPKNLHERELLTQIETFMADHILECLDTTDLCDAAKVSYPVLKKIFSKYYKCGPIEYFIRMKVDEAKGLIRSRTMNMSEIAEYLNYSSIHYFSRQFKKVMGMSPSEYASSIKAKSEPMNKN